MMSCMVATVMMNCWAAAGTTGCMAVLVKMNCEDELQGGTGRDSLGGGLGNDRLQGGAGGDSLGGGLGNDRLQGGAGGDSLYGGLGDDEVQGGEGGENFYYTGGADTLLGGPGNDSFTFGTGDRFYPTPSSPGYPSYIRDIILIDGGEGLDVLEFGVGSRGSEEPYIIDMTREKSISDNTGSIRNIERITVDGLSIVFLVDNMDFSTVPIIEWTQFFQPYVGIRGTDDDNHIIGHQKDSVSIYGGAGDDVLKGRWLDGDSGDDILTAIGTKRYFLEGGVGNDRLVGSEVGGQLDGGLGRDILIGGSSKDLLNGGSGSDILSGGMDRFYFVPGGGQDRITDLEVGDMLILYDVDPVLFSQAAVGGNYEIRYGNGDRLTIEGLEGIECREGTVKDIVHKYTVELMEKNRRYGGEDLKNAQSATLSYYGIKSALKEYGYYIDLFSGRVDLDYRLMNENDVDDMILIIENISRKE